MAEKEEDASHLATTAQSGQASDSLRILPDAAAASGLSGNADEGAVLDPIGDRLDTPVFRLGPEHYALKGQSSQVDALARAMPAHHPEIDFTVRDRAPATERASEAQARVISRLECAAKSIRTVLSRLDAPPDAAVAGVTPHNLVRETQEAMAERETAQISALESRLAAQHPDISDCAQPEVIRDALRAELADVLPALADARDSEAICALRDTIARLESQVAALAGTGDGSELQRWIDRRIAGLTETLQTDIGMRIAAVIDSRLAAQAQKTGPVCPDAALRAVQEIAEVQAEKSAELTERLDAMQARLEIIADRVSEPDLVTFAEAVAGQMATLETTLAVRIDEAWPGPDALQPPADALPEQVAAALEEPLSAIAARLAAGEAGAVRLDERIGELNAALDSRFENQSAKILTSLTTRLAQQPLQSELKTRLDELAAQLGRIEPMLATEAEARQDAACRQTDVLAMHLESVVSKATETLGGYLLGAENLVQAKLEAQQNNLLSTLLRHLTDLGDRIECLTVESDQPDNLTDTLRAAQEAEFARLTNSLDALGEAVHGLQEKGGTAAAIGDPVSAFAEDVEHKMLGWVDDICRALTDRLDETRRTAIAEAHSSPEMDSILRRLDAQAARFEEAALPVLFPADPPGIVAQLRKAEARLTERIGQIASGGIENDSLTQFSAELKANLSRFDRRVSELESRSADGEVLQDVKMVLAEYLAQMDRQIVIAERLRRIG